MFRLIFVNKEIEDRAQAIISRFPEAKVIVIESEDEIYKHVPTFHDGKKHLYVDIHKGNFVKSCPGTDKTYRCCQYYVINELTNCPLDCSYCILQHYLDLPVLTYYVNMEDMFKEIQQLAQKFPHRIIRIGTGELADSLAVDHILKINQQIIPLMQSLTNMVFEVKTKTNRVDHLLSLAYPRLVFSWSVNPEEIIEREEKKTSSLPARLEAMKKISRTKAKIGLHFDPIIYYDHWQDGYGNLIQQLQSTVPANKIAWISMGSFRHPVDLQFTIMKNHPHTKLYAAEFITGMDGKRRYPSFLRLEMYQFIYQALRKAFGEDVFIYFCMEHPEIWQKTMGKVPSSNPELDYWFAQSLYSRFPDMQLPEPFRENYPEDW